MTDKISPFYSESELAAITKELYGLEGGIKPLVSYEDQNARLTVDGVEYVLKIANANMDIADLEFQNAALEHLAKVLPDAGLPRVIHNLDGGTIAMHEGHAVRLMTFVPGSVYAHAKRTPKLHASFGRYMAKFNRALQGFEHPGAYRDDFIWGLDNLMMAKAFVHHIALKDNRERVERYFARYEAEVLPKLKGLRKAIIHQDANDHNVLVNEAGEVSGLIDFGDIMWGSQINELAIMLAYAMQNTDDILGAAEGIIAAYNQVFPLLEDEVEIVLNLAAMRIVQSVTLSSRDSKDDPDNEYLVVSQAPGFALLKKLEAIGPEFLRIFTKTIVGRLSAKDTAAHHFLSSCDSFCDLFPFALHRDESISISMVDGAEGSELIADQAAYSVWLNDKMQAAGARFAIGAYGEDRNCYTSANFVDTSSGEPRSMHMGLDLFVPAGTPLFAPLAGKVFSMHDNAAALDYGPTVILEHKVPDSDISFYTLYGHLARRSLSMLRVGDAVTAGQQIGLIGDRDVNGGWAPHLHLQIMTHMLGNTHDFPGACEASRWNVWQNICLDPDLLLGLAA